MERFTSKELQRRARITKIQVNWWTQIGIIKPIEDHRGRGNVRIFSKRNVIEAIVCRQILHVPCDHWMAFQVLEAMRNKLQLWDKFQSDPKMEGMFLVIWMSDHKLPEVFYARFANPKNGEKNLEDVIESESLVIILNLEAIIAEAENRCLL